MRNIFQTNNYQSGYQTKKIILFVLYILIAIGAVIFIINFAQTGRLSIEGLDDKQTNTIQIIKQSKGELISSSEVQAKVYSKFLSAGSYELRIADSDERAVTYLVSVSRFFSTTTKVVVLENQSDRQKLARDVSDCPLLVGGQLYSYTCGWSNTLTQHTPLNASGYSLRQDSPISGVITATPYRDGILALRIINNQTQTRPVLSFIKGSKIVSDKNLPSSFTNSDSSISPEYTLVVDRNNPDSFMASRKSNNIELAFFKNLETQAVSKKVEHESLSLERLASSLDLSSNKLLVAVGSTALPLKDGYEEQAAKPTTTIIRIFDLASPDQKPTEFKTPEPFINISFCGADSYCLLRDAKLLIYKEVKGKLALRGAINQVDSFTQLNQTDIAYQQDGKLYKFKLDDLSGTLLFGSKKFKTTSVFYSTTSLLMNASLDEDLDPGTTHTFLLGQASAKNKLVAENKLPYPRNETIADFDYAGKTILITLLLNSSTLDRATEKVAYDQVEYNQVTTAINERLAKDGFSAPEYTISYIVSY